MTQNTNGIIYKNVLAWRGSEKLYLDQRTCDVNLMFETENGEIEKVPAHKCILSAISEVFDAMFFGPSKQDGDVKIVDSSAEAFKEFLQYFYRSTVRLTADNVAEVMNLAKQYMLNDCLNACTDFCKETLTLDNVCWGYELAILFEQDDLKMFCEQKINEHPKEIFQSNSFLICDKNLLRHILQLNSLSCDESVLFDGCMAWAKAACIQKGVDEKRMDNLRGQLGDLFYEIRFGEMSAEKFISCYCLYEGLFSVEEMKELGINRSNELTNRKFNRCPRQARKKHSNGDILVCNRGHSISQRKLVIRGADKTIFTSNRALLLKKIHCIEAFNREYDRRQGQPFLLAAIQMTGKHIENETEEILYASQTSFKVTSENIIELPSPIVIKPDVKYEIQIYLDDINQEEHFYYTYLKCKDEVPLEDGINIKFERTKKDQYGKEIEMQYGFVKQLDFIRYHE